MPIKPTVGRCVYFFVDNEQTQPFDAHICYVHNDSMINIAYFNHVGEPRAMTSVPLWDGEGARPTEAHCEWMPYQMGQARNEQNAR